jgi:hypothetical protein
VVNKEAKRKIGTAIRILVSVSLLSFLVIRNIDNINEIERAIKEINMPLIVLAIFVYFLSLAVIVLRWGSLLKAQDVNIPKRYLLQTVLIGFFYNNILPTSVAGDAFRVYDIRNNKDIPVNKGLASVTLERFTSFLVGTIFILIFVILELTGFLNYKFLNKSIMIIILFITIMPILLFIVILKPHIFKINVLFSKIKFLSRIKPGLLKYQKIFVDYWRNRKRALLTCFLYSLLIHFLVTLSYYIALRSVGSYLNFFYFLFILPISSAIANIPVSIGGIGLRENTLMFMLVLMGIPKEIAFVFSILILFIILFNALIGGLVYLFRNIFFRSPHSSTVL